MITFFTTAKPFRGQIDIIQRNAIGSWLRVHPAAEVILFGDEEGAAAAARDLAIRHVPQVQRNQHGTKYLTPIFDQAQELASHDRLCYVNCDIILLSDFRPALEQVLGQARPFLMAGRRWDTDIAARIDFASPDWQAVVRREAQKASRQRPPQWIDYFAFSRGLYRHHTPPFLLGRPGWDNWLVWQARAAGALVVDASAAVQAVHQNHDYAYHPQGEAGVWQGAEAQENYALLEGGRCFATLENATHRLGRGGLRPNYYHWLALARRRAARAGSAAWFALLDFTRPLRRRLGLHRRREP